MHVFDLKSICRLRPRCAKNLFAIPVETAFRWKLLKWGSATFSVTQTTEQNPVFRNQPRTRPVELTDPLWERQHGETRQAFEAFVIYRDIPTEYALQKPDNRRLISPTRSYDVVAKRLGKSNTLIERWGRRWHWVYRVAAFDREIEREQARQSKETRVKALARQRTIAISMQTVAGHRVSALLASIRKTQELETAVAQEVASREAVGQLVSDEDKLKIRAAAKLAMGPFEEVKLTPRDMTAMFREGVHVERLVMGEPTEHRIDMTSEEMLNKRVADAVADARINHSEHPGIPLTEHLQWAADFAGLPVDDVMRAAGVAPVSAGGPITAHGGDSVS